MIPISDGDDAARATGSDTIFTVDFDFDITGIGVNIAVITGVIVVVIGVTSGIFVGVLVITIDVFEFFIGIFFIVGVIVDVEEFGTIGV